MTLVQRRAGAKVQQPGGDALLLCILVFAQLQISGLAESAALPTRVADVLRHPILGNILPEAGEAAMGEVGPRPGEPIGLLLIALTLCSTLLYLLADLALAERWRRRAKWSLLVAILLFALFLPTAKLILLRQQSGPASYTHDGGVIQTEAAIGYFLAGKNPYREDYVDTPMAEWGFSQYRTALYHYPYLPWTFLLSAPFYLLGQAAGYYDQRIVYLLLIAAALALAPSLAQGERRRLALAACLGLNPIMALDLIFGQNDAFVLCWILFGLVAWRRWRIQRQIGRRATALWWIGTVCYGLACASKPTAWFFAPYVGLLWLDDGQEWRPISWQELGRSIPAIVGRLWPALLVFGLVMLPYAVWDGYALYDDVWRWSTGQGETGYQIWGWGASNFVLALGLVRDRFALWPFWASELIVGAPLLLWFVHRQARANTLANACWHYGVWLLAFFYTSRFLNENYLGYILAFLATGWFSQEISDNMTG
jgi:hypothetical protein